MKLCRGRASQRVEGAMRAHEPLRPGQRFKGFTVVRLLGQGGMGAVFEVVGRGGRRYALKVLQPTWHDREAQVRRMLDEGIVMVGIRHVNIVEVHDHGEHEGLVWLLMELLEGETVRARMLREGPLSVDVACATLRAAAYAAEQCHALGIVHRDIKPENFMLTGEDRLKMLDLGIAHIHGSTMTQEPIGTPAYMAPEQFNTRLGVSPSTDVYALGLMAFEMLAGFHPFLRDDQGEERNAWELCFEHAFTLAPPLSSLGFPRALSDVVSRATAKDPRERYPSGGALAEAISEAWRILRERPEQGGRGDPRLAPGSEGRRSGAGMVRNVPSAARAPVRQAPSERLPREMTDPAAVGAYLIARSESAAAAGVHPRGGTLRMVSSPDDASPPRGGTVRMGAAPPSGTAPFAWGQPTPAPGRGASFAQLAEPGSAEADDGSEVPTRVPGSAPGYRMAAGATRGSAPARRRLLWVASGGAVALLLFLIVHPRLVALSEASTVHAGMPAALFARQAAGDTEAPSLQRVLASPSGGEAAPSLSEGQSGQEPRGSLPGSPPVRPEGRPEVSPRPASRPEEPSPARPEERLWALPLPLSRPEVQSPVRPEERPNGLPAVARSSVARRDASTSLASAGPSAKRPEATHKPVRETANAAPAGASKPSSHPRHPRPF
ncbi:serine/threonine-protein kinase [Chondromyces apiculatus]|uniref:Protein kinase domain-containing protein n=1 Tax=Chondromyces apiculatus DSM 436 TaxID=1192034 RepID=A0A017SWW9_9BACT|nr:serine/threonine-protein kinase [Chondromyces apiculatus]EYF01070.1 Hypothetical protein CAP_8727 [Chondromyces apiculatus DSM 436]